MTQPRLQIFWEKPCSVLFLHCHYHSKSTSFPPTASTQQDLTPLTAVWVSKFPAPPYTVVLKSLVIITYLSCLIFLYGLGGFMEKFLDCLIHHLSPSAWPHSEWRSWWMCLISLQPGWKPNQWEKKDAIYLWVILEQQSHGVTTSYTKRYQTGTWRIGLCPWLPPWESVQINSFLSAKESDHDTKSAHQSLSVTLLTLWFAFPFAMRNALIFTRMPLLPHLMEASQVHGKPGKTRWDWKVPFHRAENWSSGQGCVYQKSYWNKMMHFRIWDPEP